ncbi:MAG TPA: VOC family protein [Burkholderiaceae bacterium]
MLKNRPAFGSFSTTDLQAAQAFYGQTLGLDARIGKMDVLELQLAGGMKVIVYPKANHQPATHTVLNFQVPDVEAAVAELGQRGVRFERYDLPGLKTDAKGICRDPGGPVIAWFKDPAGNILSLVEG